MRDKRWRLEWRGSIGIGDGSPSYYLISISAQEECWTRKTIKRTRRSVVSAGNGWFACLCGNLAWQKVLINTVCINSSHGKHTTKAQPINVIDRSHADLTRSVASLKYDSWWISLGEKENDPATCGRLDDATRRERLLWTCRRLKVKVQRLAGT